MFIFILSSKYTCFRGNFESIYEVNYSVKYNFLCIKCIIFPSLKLVCTVVWEICYLNSITLII